MAVDTGGVWCENHILAIEKGQHAWWFDLEDIEAGAFKARNRYWVDPGDGFIVQSEQHLTPHLTLTITQLQPTRKDAP